MNVEDTGRMLKVPIRQVRRLCENSWSVGRREIVISLPAEPWSPEAWAKRGPALTVVGGKSLKRLAHPKGFEPLASAFGGQREWPTPLKINGNSEAIEENPAGSTGEARAKHGRKS